jgi:large subunit ribosomal protein L10
MAISRAAKETAVETLTGELGRIKLAVMTDYRGLTVREVEELRDICVKKASLTGLPKTRCCASLLKTTPPSKDIDPKTFTGPMALALGFDDEVAPARVIFQYAKKHDALEIVGGITGDGQVLTAAQVKALGDPAHPRATHCSSGWYHRGPSHRLCRRHERQRSFHH